MTRGRPLAALAAVALTAVLVLLPAKAALAHAVLERSSPRDGATISTLPDHVQLAFNENVATPAFVNVIAPDGSNVAVGDPAILDNTVTQPVEPPGEAGTYLMSYRVVSADGHPVSATLSFKVTTGRHVAAPATPTPDESRSSHKGLVLAAALAVVIVVIALIALTGRRYREPEQLEADDEK